MITLLQARGPLRGRLRVPGDKSVSHRVALLAPLAGSPCRATGWLDADDTRRSLQATHDLGGRSELRDGVLTIWPGVYPAGAATGVALAIDCGNSGTTARLLTGLLSGVRGDIILTGDASLCGRPMARVVDPLRAMGADITYVAENGRLPLRIRGGALRGGDHALEVPSAQVKSALLLAGLAARGRTRVTGAEGSRDHTERLLTLMGAPIRVVDPGSGGETEIDGGMGSLRPFDVTVPGDPSSAAFLLAAALLVPASELVVEGFLLSETRAGFLAALRAADAPLVVTAAETPWPAEPCGDATARHGAMRGFEIGPAMVPGLVDELPVLAVVATQATGETVVTGARELRVKECDRLAAMARELGRLGARIEERPDGWRIEGPTPLRVPEPGSKGGSPHVVVTEGDHRVAMAMAVAALVTEGPVALDDADCLAVSYPGFLADLARLVGGGSDRPGDAVTA